MAKEVAILQNQFRLSGRTKLICEMVSVLNELDIKPHILSLTPTSEAVKVPSFFGAGNLDFQYHQISRIPFIRGGFSQIIFLNLATRKIHSDFELVINSNNMLEGLNPSAKYLHYIHFPLKGYVDEQKSISRVNFAYASYLKFFQFILSRLKTSGFSSEFLTNSQFTQGILREYYPSLRNKPIHVVYPPAYNEICSSKSSDRQMRCVSIGAITPVKRQFNQILLAERIPDLEFIIVGAIKSQHYFNQCQNYVSSRKITNVHFMPHLKHFELHDMLKKSTFFLHTREKEHFGISTVEAIAAGCVPIVPNSGGQIEIVPSNEYRFDTIDDATAKFQQLLIASPRELDMIREMLQAHIHKFSCTAFRQTVREKFSNLLH